MVVTFYVETTDRKRADRAESALVRFPEMLVLWATDGIPQADI